MQFLHTMIRVNDLNESLKFYCDGLGMKLIRKNDFPNGEFTLAFVGYGDERSHTVVELTHNWGKSNYAIGDAFGHLADVAHVAHLIIGNGDVEFVFQGEEDFHRVHRIDPQLLEFAVDRDLFEGNPLGGGDAFEDALRQFVGHMSRPIVSNV